MLSTMNETVKRFVQFHLGYATMCEKNVTD